jgi:hypothetical protein
MSDRSQLDCDIHNLLDQANVYVLAGVRDVAAAKGLIIGMRHCADQAAKAQLPQSAQRLREAADAIEMRVQNMRNA